MSRDGPEGSETKATINDLREKKQKYLGRNYVRVQILTKN